MLNGIRRAARRLRRLLTLGRVEASMEREMRAHVEFETEARIRAGATPDAARAAALRAFGPIEAFKEAGRDARGTRAVEDAARDLRYALGRLRREPGPALSAILTFALGIGAVTAIFSVLYAVLLRPLPYDHPDRLVALWESNLSRGVDQNVVSVRMFEAWRDRATSIDSIAGMVPAPVTLIDGDTAERVVGAEVSPAFFPMLGVTPLLGRTFTEDDARRGAVVVLSEQLWRNRFAADPAIVGRQIHIDGRPHDIGASHEVVGVVSATFEPPAYGWMARRQALWVPFVANPDNRAYGRYLLVIGRLSPEATIGAARTEVATISARLADEVPGSRGWSASAAPLADVIVGDAGTSLLYIFAASGLLFLLAAVNVAVLLVGRTRRRLHELGLRRALGATDGRLHRQLLVECLLLGAVGCVAGLLAAYPLVAALVAWLPPDVPRASRIALNLPVAAAALAAAAIVSLAIGSGVARSGRHAPSVLLRDAPARGTSARTGQSLIATEVAVGLVIAVLAGLMIRSFVALRDVDLGFDPSHTLVARVALDADYDGPARQVAFFDELLARLRAHPGVIEAGLVSGRPFGGTGPRTTVHDAREAAADTDPVTDVRWADGAFFRALRVPIIAGAVFDDSDRPDGPVRTVVTRALARRLWPETDAVGRTIGINVNGGLTATVIAVVEDLQLSDARSAVRPTLFLASGRFGGSGYDLVIRSAADPTTIVPDVRAALATLDPSLPLHRVDTFEAAVSDALGRDRFTAALLGSFGLVALLLAGVGIYGVCAADLAARRKEIGIRLALGARASRVVGSVLSTALATAAVGLAAGAVAAAVLASSMRPLLFGIGVLDLWSFALAAACLLGVTLMATVLPAAAATRTSPLSALRGD